MGFFNVFKRYPHKKKQFLRLNPFIDDLTQCICITYCVKSEINSLNALFFFILLFKLPKFWIYFFFHHSLFFQPLWMLNGREIRNSTYKPNKKSHTFSPLELSNLFRFVQMDLKFVLHKSFPFVSFVWTFLYSQF